MYDVCMYAPITHTRMLTVGVLYQLLYLSLVYDIGVTWYSGTGVL